MRNFALCLALPLFAFVLGSRSTPASAQDSNTQLAIAISSNNAALVRTALDAGADVNANLGEGRTPLITAVMMSRPAAVDVLLQRGADPNRSADDAAIGNAVSAAFFAMNGSALTGRSDETDPTERARALEVLRLVAAKRPNFDVLVSRGTTKLSPLMLAAQAGVVEAVRILLGAGANPSFENGGKYSALDYAVDRPPVWMQNDPADRKEIVRLLVAAGAKAQKKGADGLTPADRARRTGNAAVAEMLSATRQ